MSDVSACPSCGARLAPGATACDLCGQPVAPESTPSDAFVPEGPSGGDGAGPDPQGGVYCNACGTKNPPGARFCSQCGAPLQAPVSAPRRAPVPVAATVPVVPAGLGPRLALYLVGAVLLVGGLYLATLASRNQGDTPATFRPDVPAATAPGAAPAGGDSTGFAPLAPEIERQVTALEADVQRLSGDARTAKQNELINLLIGFGRPDRAAEAAQALAEQANTPAAWKRAGDLYYRWMEVLPEPQRPTVAPRVVAAYDRVLAATPDDLDARANLGWAAQYDATGNPMRAILETNDVLKRDSTHLGASYNRGWFLRAIGRLDQSIAQFERVRRLAGPDTPLGREAQLLIDQVRRQQAGGSATPALPGAVPPPHRSLMPAGSSTAPVPMLPPGDADGLLERLYALLGAHDDAFVVEMLGAFLDDLPAFLQRIADALNEGDLPALQHAAHHLRSGAHALGGVGIAAAALPIESAARNGDAAGAGAAVADAACRSRELRPQGLRARTAPASMTADPALVAAIAARAAALRARMDAACARVGRPPEEVTLVAVTKTHPPETLVAAAAAGLMHLGENRVQELHAKRQALPELPVTWHHIGHVQTNKARDAVRDADLVHGVDSVRLAEALARRAVQEGTPLSVLVQVNISGEASKDGCAPADAPALLAHLATLDGLRLQGLMGIAGPAEDPEHARPDFRLLRGLRDAARTDAHPLPMLSMGMSGDFEVAIEEGATHVRIGTALFGGR